MGRASGGARRVGGEPSRYRKLVHSLERVRGGQVAVQSCPLEQDCRHVLEALRGNGAPPVEQEEFRVLAALRNGRRDRPYFRAGAPLAVACPGARGRVACLLSLGETAPIEMPLAVAQAGGIRPSLSRGGAEPALAQPGPVRPAAMPVRGPEAPAYHPGPLRVTARPAPSISSAPRSLALSSMGSRHED